MARKFKTPTAVAVAPAPNPLKQIPLRVKVDGAKEVVLTGDFTQWAKDKIRLTPLSGGEWITVLELAPGDYQYRLIVDGEWRDHSEAARKIGNPFGTQNAVLTVA